MGIALLMHEQGKLELRTQFVEWRALVNWQTCQQKATEIRHYSKPLKLSGRPKGILQKTLRRSLLMIATRKPGKKPADRPSVKASFYLTQEVLVSLEEARLKLREMARPEGRAKITKSLIVEVAIQLAIEDLQASGEKSPLAGMLAWQ
jgi:hypothetical protein